MGQKWPKMAQKLVPVEKNSTAVSAASATVFISCDAADYCNGFSLIDCFVMHKTRVRSFRKHQGQGVFHTYSKFVTKVWKKSKSATYLSAI